MAAFGYKLDECPSRRSASLGPRSPDMYNAQALTRWRTYVQRHSPWRTFNGRSAKSLPLLRLRLYGEGLTNSGCCSERFHDPIGVAQTVQDQPIWAVARRHRAQRVHALP